MVPVEEYFSCPGGHGTWQMHGRTMHLGHKRDESSHNKNGGKDLSSWQNSKQPVNLMVFKDEKKS